MRDCESDEENVIVLSTDKANDAQIISLNVKKENYRPNQIEQLLKMSKTSKEHVFIKNQSEHIKSDVWEQFGFLVKLKKEQK